MGWCFIAEAGPSLTTPKLSDVWGPFSFLINGGQVVTRGLGSPRNRRPGSLRNTYRFQGLSAHPTHFA
jgi:hypothetical protein